MMFRCMKHILRYNSLVEIHLESLDFARLPVFPQPPWNVEQDGLQHGKSQNAEKHLFYIQHPFLHKAPARHRNAMAGGQKHIL